MQESNQNADLRAKLLKYASFLLSRRPYFSTQIRQKLQQKQSQISQDTSQETIEEIINDLIKAKYLNDEYLLIGFIKQKLQKLQGPKLISYKLKQLGISSAQIKSVFDHEEIKEATKLSVAKLSEKYSSLDSFQIKSKLYQRGFNV